MVAFRFVLRTICIVSGPFAVGACDAKANDSLLASELTYSRIENGWERTVTITPWLAGRPEIVRRLKSERIAEMGKTEGACETLSGDTNGCQETSDFELNYDGGRLISLTEEVLYDGGGAHPVTTYSGYLFDTASGARLQFSDLFVSWNMVRAALQKSLCEQLAERNPGYKCPDIRKQAIALSAGTNGRVDAFTVQTQDYALGSYADGQELVRLDLNPVVFAQIKPEYQAEFAATGGT